MRSRALTRSFVIGLMGAATGAWANEPVVYDRAYFETFGPQNAADMVAQIPGFVIRGREGGERGFGQASLNVLINGRRPSSKSLGANQILERISVDRVVRIEIVDGTSLDIPGLSGDVANIVTESFGVTGNWEYAARFEEGTEPQLLDAEASVSVARGDVTVTVSTDIGQFTQSTDGVERFFTPDDVLFEDRRERIIRENQRPSIDGALNWARPSGEVLNVTGEFQLSNRNLDVRETFVATAPGGNDGQSVFFSGEDEIEYEIGADYEFGLGGFTEDARLKVIGLYSFEDSAFTSRNADFIDGQAPVRSEFLQEFLETEVIGRAEYSWDAGAWQASVEYAFNELDATSEFDGEALTPVRVTEDRVQGALSHTLRLGAWDVQANAGAEYSELAVPSVVDSEAQTFLRPKGFVSASRDLDARHTLVLRADRSVGQLNFFDFVSDIDLDEGRDERGNTRIVPNQQTSVEFTVERTDPEGFSWRLNPKVAQISDPIDRVRFADGSEGPGNLESDAYFYGVEGNFTWVMDRIVQGMRLSGDFNAFETDIEDPLTGERRRFNGNAPYAGSLELRHDIANTPYAYEIDVARRADVDIFFFDQSQVRGFDYLGMTARVEHKDVYGLNVALILQNVADEAAERTRLLFDGDRLDAVLRREEQRRKSGRRLSVVVSGTF